MPFLLRLQVPLAQMGKDLCGPKKHLRPHLASMRVRSWALGAKALQPALGFVPPPKTNVIYIYLRIIYDRAT